MSFPPPPGQDPNNPYAQPQQPQGQPYGYPQQQPPQPAPGYGYPAQPPQAQQQPYGYPQQAPAPQGPGYGYPQAGAAGYGVPPYAGWWQRFGARFVDTVIILVPYYAVTIIGTLIAASGDGSSGSVGVAIFFSFLALAIAIGGSLWISYLKGSRGQSVGQKLVGIRLAREIDGQNVGFGLAFGRELLHFLDSLACGIGYLWPAWDQKKQTFADKVVNTVVVRIQ